MNTTVADLSVFQQFNSAADFLREVLFRYHPSMQLTDYGDQHTITDIRGNQISYDVCPAGDPERLNKVYKRWEKLCPAMNCADVLDIIMSILNYFGVKNMMKEGYNIRIQGNLLRLT